MAQYIQVTEQFTADNNNYYDEPNVLHIVQTLNKKYVTSVNSYNEFTTLFQQKYNFIVVSDTFYNQYNNTPSVSGGDPLVIRKRSEEHTSELQSH